MYWILLNSFYFSLEYSLLQEHRVSHMKDLVHYVVVLVQRNSLLIVGELN